MNELIRIGDAEFATGELEYFLAKAKKVCYAGNGKEQRLADGSTQLTFEDGPFHYTDNYAGYFQAQGAEIVRWERPEGQRIWQMAYSGGMLPGFYNPSLASKTFDFLKKTLARVSVDAPFRGPESLSLQPGSDMSGLGFYEGEFYYWATTVGNIRRFSGKERITHADGVHKAEMVFEQDYHGGLVIPE